MTRSSPASLIDPGGIASAAASPSGTTSARQSTARAATRASARAKAMKVRCVPSRGIATRAETIVPTSEPAVEIA